MANFHEARGFTDYMIVTMKRLRYQQQGRGVLTLGEVFYGENHFIDGSSKDWGDVLFEPRKQLPGARKLKLIPAPKKRKAAAVQIIDVKAE